MIGWTIADAGLVAVQHLCFDLRCACHAVLCCAVLCCAVLCCAVLCCAVLCCAMLCCAVLCSVLCHAVLCRAVLCRAMLCRAVPCCAVLCRAVPCCAVLYNLNVLCYRRTTLVDIVQHVNWWCSSVAQNNECVFQSTSKSSSFIHSLMIDNMAAHCDMVQHRTSPRSSKLAGHIQLGHCKFKLSVRTMCRRACVVLHNSGICPTTLDAVGHVLSVAMT